MTFKDVIHTVSSNVFFKLLIPNWGMRLTKKLRRIQLAFDELEVSRRSICSAFHKVEYDSAPVELHSGNDRSSQVTGKSRSKI